MASKPFFILFVSTGNSARSQIAQTLLNSKNSNCYKARSAGVFPLEEIPFSTKSFLEMEGYETGKLYPKSWKDFYNASDYLPIDVIVTLSEEARIICQEQEWPSNSVCVHWVVDDPLGSKNPEQQEWKYKKCFSVLEARINALVKERPITSQCEALLRFKDIGMVV